MAAEAVPVEEMAIHTEAFQDVEVFPTEFTQILCPSLHRTPGYRVSWTQSHPPRPAFRSPAALPTLGGLRRQGSGSHLLVF